MTPNKIIVFLGPSLSLTSAKKILPEAVFLPPIRCGDILQTMKMDPSDIIIIDGYFERMPSVWHKEILFAMEKGIRVYGAASMGALRASELYDYGMIGIGEVFNLFKNQEIEDDDEVAVLHHDAQADYKGLTDALVNIRATMKNAIKNGIINESEAELIIQKSKEIYYKERVLIKICNLTDMASDKKEHLINFIIQGGYVDLKANDAMQALEFIQNSEKNTSNKYPITPKTLFFRTLKHFVTCKTFPYPINNSSLEMQYQIYSRLLDSKYKNLLKQSMLMSVVYRIGTSLNFKATPTELSLNINFLSNELNKQFTDKLSIIKKTQSSYPSFISIKELALIEGHNLTDQSSTEHLNNLIALYSPIISKANELGLAIRSKNFEKYIIKFREKHQLINQTDLNQWLSQHQISIHRLTEILHAFAIIDFIAYRNNADILNISQDNDFENWFLLAMCSTGLYSEIAALIANPKALKAAIKKLIADSNIHGDSYLNALDFMDQGDLNSFIKKLSMR